MFFCDFCVLFINKIVGITLISKVIHCLHMVVIVTGLLKCVKLNMSGPVSTLAMCLQADTGQHEEAEVQIDEVRYLWSDFTG